MPAFFVAPRTYKSISQGSYKDQVIEPGCQYTQKVNNIL